jgi:putative peptidoglycan lipid II flippase
VLGFAVRANFLELDRALVQSLAKFLGTGVVLALALWLTAHFAAAHLTAIGAFPDEIILLLLIGIGSVVYAGSILLLFGPRWLRSFLRG